MQKKYYITTPIYYPSGEAHLGHGYSTVAADVLARYKRLQNYDVMFLTGTDEHGQKIELNAKKENLEPKKYVDNMIPKFKNLWKVLNISYDKFIRTTDAYHIKSVQKIFEDLYNKGEIYKGEYVGWYCVPCESFFTDSQLKDNKCPDCGREVKKEKEESYFFKLSKYSGKLLDLYKNNPEFIQPESRKNEMISFIKENLTDLCVSRTSFKWGIPVNFDKNHVVYVWLDALSNYITALGYESEDDSNLKKYWPADVHIVGKEIVRFHAIVWPAVLMALNLELPKRVFGHGWLLFGENKDKMSKSKGNIVDPNILCSRYGTDSIRYFLMREISFGLDGTFTNEVLLNRINSDLANDLGNLVFRTLTMIEKYFNNKLVSKSEFNKDLDSDLINTAENLSSEYQKHMDNFKFSIALEKIWNLIFKLNKYIEKTVPWDLAKIVNKKERLSTVLYNLCESLRIISILILPFMPECAKKIQVMLGINSEVLDWISVSKFGMYNLNSDIKAREVLFPRIDIEKELEILGDLNKNIVNLINIQDFCNVELKVFEILECEKIKKSKKLLKLTVTDNFNNENSKRIVVSGIAEYYEPKDLINKNVILVSNLKPAKLCGVESNGMILAAFDTYKNTVKIIFVDDISVGSKIS
ncbi:MAG: methionine--tRNA ligase [Candidatus Paraimprobicoccus trichonymphae]|uniref:Methionine--tRNA ligase n=1 Tax=Candidatus Paraimprobicoccus trichonymphae TaxID=3033793 RepID=A0AA48IC39_9FIRM|nr:MAG: methionine--tRNA ligase [Candidatus Paraimprobicoccus trichonymphae]